jgi:hypothetical protein
MTRRLVLFICGSAALAALAFFVCHLAFSDVLPYAVDENAQQSWRRDAAFFVTTVAWLSAEVSAVGIIWLFAVLLRDRRIKMRQLG